MKERLAARRAGNINSTSASGTIRASNFRSAQAAQKAVPGPSMAAAILTDNDRQIFSPQLNSEQWAAVMALYNSMTPVSAPSGKFASWILDTGASFHMTGDKSLL